MRVITICSRPLDDDTDLSDSRQPYMMRESIQRFGIPLEVKIMPFDHGGWSHLAWFKAELARMPRDTIVLTTDCWDAFFAGTAAEIEAEFLRFEVGIVHAVEHYLWPADEQILSKYPPSPTAYRFINGGGMIGYAGSLLDRYEHKAFWNWPRVTINQQAYHEWLCRYPDSAKLDHYCRIFQVRTDDLRTRGGRVYNKETGSRPLVVHGPGGGARKAAELWERLKQSTQADTRRIERLRAERRQILARR